VALLEQGADFGPGEPLVLMVGGLDRWVQVADGLRHSCVGVFGLPERTDPDILPLLARQKEIQILVEPVAGTEGARWTVTDLGAGASEGCALDDLVDLVCHAALGHEDQRS
jgi:hypothetical protein